MEIPPPNFQTVDCYIQCCLCSKDCVLYWVRDDVWQRLESAAQCCGGHVCVQCAEKFLGRELTLNDLAIEKYLLTANNEIGSKQRRVIHCIVDTVLGAANEAGVIAPSHWCYMWDQYFDLGKKLASQTINPEQVVPRLIRETETHFPNFSNPYLVD